MKGYTQVLTFNLFVNRICSLAVLGSSSLGPAGTELPWDLAVELWILDAAC